MEIIKDITQWKEDKAPSVIALGFFDGFHLGHQAILETALAWSKETGAIPTVVTFDRHPWELLHPEKLPEKLLGNLEKNAYLENIGFDRLIELPLCQKTLELSAREFFEWLVNVLKPVGLVVGPNYHFGHSQEGNSELLANWAKEAGFEVKIVDYVQMGGLPISSARIRTLLKAGEVGLAGEMLGRTYHLTGKVIAGDGRGKTIGFPTANFELESGALLPASGVYAVWVKKASHWLPAVASVGTNPTFPGERAKRLEVHLIHFDEDLYGQTLKVAFAEYLRPELVFSGVDQLVEKMEIDLKNAVTSLENEQVKAMLPNW